MTALTKSLTCLAAMLAVCDADADELPAPKVCQLGQVVSLNVTTGAEGMIFVNGDVDGHKGDFLIDTGGMGLVLNFTTSTHLSNGPQRAFMSGQLVGGTTLDYGVFAKRLVIGGISSVNPWFLVAPDRILPSDAIGNIQPHALWPYDVEIDFWKGKLNLFLKNQCPGHVVYWTKEPYAAVPMVLDDAGHITVRAVLDGKSVDALVDTGSQSSFISLRAASHILDVDEDTKGMTSADPVFINNAVHAKRYHYPFKSLTFEGIAIANPKIEIADTGNDSRRDPLILGIGVLRQLHLFVAYDESRLYLTLAEAK